MKFETPAKHSKAHRLRATRTSVVRVPKQEIHWSSVIVPTLTHPPIPTARKPCAVWREDQIPNLNLNL